MLHWIFLVVASCLEVCWIYSLKFMNVQKIREIHWADFFMTTGPILTLAPLLGYIVFGVTNIILFSYAMKTIPASTAFAVWMALALVGVKVVDTLVFGERFSLTHLLYISLILIGIIGLKKTL